jgi:hypothetical protein
MFIYKLALRITRENRNLKAKGCHMPEDFEPADYLPEFINHRTIEIPILCGNKKGKAYIYSNIDNLENGLLETYTSKLKKRIEDRKYRESETLHYDEGPIPAGANFVEDGEFLLFNKEFEDDVKNGRYDCLLVKYSDAERELFKINFEIDSLEKVLKFKDDNHSYHMLPLISGIELSFKNDIQKALMKYATYVHVIKNPYINVNDDLLNWIISDDKRNAKIFHESLCETRVNKIYDSPREYKFPLYEDFFEKYFEKIGLDARGIKDAAKQKEGIISLLSK